MSVPSVDLIDGPGELIRQVVLVFEHQGALRHVDDPIHEDLSSAARVGNSRFVSCDETAGVDRLVPDAKGIWRHDARFNLGDVFDLPDGPDGEMDIEGLEADGSALWVCGSQAPGRLKQRTQEVLADVVRFA